MNHGLGTRARTPDAVVAVTASTEQRPISANRNTNAPVAPALIDARRSTPDPTMWSRTTVFGAKPDPTTARVGPVPTRRSGVPAPAAAVVAVETRTATNDA